MTEPVPGTPNDDTRSLVPGGTGDSFADAAEGIEVGAWNVPEQLGPYRIVRELGRGGMAAVYLATHRDDDREVALKVMAASDDAAGRDLVARFQREAASARRLGDHPNIVTVYDSGADGPYCWMAMQRITGAGLDELADSGDLSFEQAAHIIERVALAVEHAHAGGVLHRDIKPSNVLVRPNGTPLLADFGLARTYGHSDLTRITASGTVLGTPSYMPPEQAQGETLDARADIYSLGATLFELITGRPPFTSGRMLALLQKVVSEPPPFPRVLNPAVPPRLEWIVLRCLEKDPARRYATAAALATDLANFRTGDAVEAGRGSAARRLRGLWQRRPMLVGASLAIGATALVSAGILLWGGRAERDAKADIAETHADTETLGRERQVADAFYTLQLQTSDAMSRLEDFYFGAPMSDAERRAALAPALSVVAQAAEKYPQAGVPAAWGGLLRFYAGEAAAGEQQIVQASVDQPLDPFPHLLLGRLCMSRYAHRIAGGTLVFGIGRVDFTPLEEDDGSRLLRERSAESFAAGLDPRRWDGVGGGEGYRAFAEGAALFAARDNSGAVAVLGALSDDPQLGPSALALAAAADFYDKRWDAASARLDALAARGWGVALKIGSQSHLAAGLERMGRGDDPGPDLDRVIVMADELIGRAPEQSGAWVDRAAARQALAKGRMDAGQDPRSLLAQAVRDVEHAYTLNPTGEGLMHRALLGIETARAERRFGGDPAPHLTDALKAIERAVAEHPGVAEWRSTRAEVLFQMGQERERMGKDARSLYSAATEDLEGVKASVRDPVGVFHTLGNLYRALALIAERDGEDPLPLLDRSIHAYGEVMTLVPDDGRPIAGRGAAWAIRAGVESRAGQDPERSFANALADFEEAVRRNPRLPSARQNRAACWAEKGAADAKFGRDARPAFEAAVEGFSAALEITPGHPASLEGRAKVWWRLARIARGRRLDSAAAVGSTLADLGAAIERDPRSVQLRRLRAGALQEFAGWAADGDAGLRTQRLRAAAEDLEAIDRLRPGDDRGLVKLALLYESLEAWADAVGAYDRALKIRPGHAQLLERRAAALARAK